MRLRQPTSSLDPETLRPWPAGWDSRHCEPRSQPRERAAQTRSSRSPGLFLCRRCRLQLAWLTPQSFSSCCVTLAVWLRSAKCVEQDVQIANHGDEECVMNSDMVGNHALDQRNDRAAHDGHIQNAGTISCQRPEFGYSKTEDAGEHDGVEKSDCQNAPHGEVSGAQHRNDDQG